MNTPNDTTTQGNLSAALALAGQGIAVFPVGPDKRPLFKGWQAKATTDAARIRVWWRDHPDAMPALLTGKRNGFAVLDVDRKNGKDGFAELAGLGLDVDALSAAQVVTASGGRHIYFRWSEGMTNSADGLPPGLDVRGEGGFVVAPGAVNGKGVYELLSGRLTAELPAWPDALPIRRKAAEPGEARPTGLPWPVFAEAVRAVPNDIPDRETWVARLAAIHAESGGDPDGLALAHEWSARHKTYDPAETDRVWASFKRSDGATGWRFIRDAQKLGFRHPELDQLDAAELDQCWSEDELAAAAHEAEEAVCDHWADHFGLDDDMRRLLGAPVSSEEADPSFGLTLLDPDQCASFKPAPYVAKGLIAQGDVACIVGAPGVGKTPAASEAAYCVSLGKDAFGMRTRQGGVLYLATENERDMRKRVTALRDRHGYSLDFHVVADCAGRFADKDFLKRLKRLIVARRPVLIVVDTLGAAMPGFDENSSEGMGVVLAICQSLRRLGPAVLLVHHDTKGGDGLPRGHSSLNGALDMNLALKRGEDGVVVGVPSKNKNGPSNEPILAFRIKVVELGIDDDLDPITTVVCEEEGVAGLPKKKAKGEKLSASARAVLGILEELTRNGDRPTTRKEWRAACLASDKVCASDEMQSKRAALRRALEALAQGGLYTVHGADLEEIRLVVAPAMLDPDDDHGEALI